MARLGTSLLAIDAIASISATTRGKRASDALAKLIYHFKDTNPLYENSAIARIFSISESTLRGILKRGIRRSDRQKKVKLGRKSVLTKRIERQMGIDEVFLIRIPSTGRRSQNEQKKVTGLCAAFNGWLVLWMVLFTTTKSG